MERKKRLTNDQIEMLERSFQEDVKLEPERKMRLARELGLQPRQVAVWFQNRRARWKTKELQRVYDALKLDYEAISMEKQMLQEEVMKLKARLAAAVNQGSTSYTEVSPQDTMESTAAVICNSSNNNNNSDGLAAAAATTTTTTTRNYPDLEISECNHLFNLDDYNPAALPPYWAVLPGYP